MQTSGRYAEALPTDASLSSDVADGPTFVDAFDQPASSLGGQRGVLMPHVHPEAGCMVTSLARFKSYRVDG